MFLLAGCFALALLLGLYRVERSAQLARRRGGSGPGSAEPCPHHAQGCQPMSTVQVVSGP